MLSGNKSVSVKKFESYRCCFEEMEFHKKGRVLHARTGEREKKRKRELGPLCLVNIVRQ
jgi:hypothetical protein